MSIKIPVSVIGEDKEAPKVGDGVMLPDVMAVVTAIDGDKMAVRIKSVGDCQCDEEEGEEAAEPTEESVMKLAMKEDGE